MTPNQYNIWESFCRHQHDVVCNQKYNKTLPYSFHLDLVTGNAEVFYEYISWHGEDWVSQPTFDVKMAKCVAMGHDLIEDARLTYNDVLSELVFTVPELPNVRNDIADAIFACTECRGKTRKERHSEYYYSTLLQNDLAIYVKLCDIMANVQFSKMTHSSMYKRYQNEFPGFVDRLSTKQNDMFSFILSWIWSELRLN